MLSWSLEKKTKELELLRLELGPFLSPSFLHLILDISVYCFFLMFSWSTSAKNLLLSPLIPFKLLYRLSASGKHCRGVPSWPHYGQMKVEYSDRFWLKKLYFPKSPNISVSLHIARHLPPFPSSRYHQPRSMNVFSPFKDVKNKGSCHNITKNTWRLTLNVSVLRFLIARGQMRSASTSPTENLQRLKPPLSDFIRRQFSFG